MAKERIVELDILKCFGIILVVIGHTKCPSLLDSMIYFIHMPLFFYLSGVTNRGDDYYGRVSNLKEFFVKRIHTLYIPFLKFAIPICLLHNAIYAIGLYKVQYDTMQYVMQIVRTLLFSVGETEPFLPQLWFIKVLFIAEVMYAAVVYVCHRLSISKWKVIVPLCVAFLLMPTEWFPHVMHTNFIWPMRAMLFYAIGGLHTRLMSSWFNSRWAMSFGLVVWVVASATFGQLGIQAVSGISAIVLIYLITFTIPSLWALATIAKRPPKLCTALIGGGKLCIHIYFWHYVAFKTLSAVYVWLFAPQLSDRLLNSYFIDNINWSLYAIAGVLLPIVLLKAKARFTKIIGFRKN